MTADPTDLSSDRAADLNGSAAELDVQERLRNRAREIAGVDGGERDQRSFRQILRDERAPLYPLAALMALTVSQSIGTAGAASLYPEIARSLGFGVTLAAVSSLLSQIVGFLIPLATSFLVRDRPIRAWVTIVSALAWSLTVVWAGFIPTATLFVAYQLVDAMTSSANGTVIGSLAMDLYPPRVRVRAFAFLYSAESAAQVIVPLMVVVLVSGFDLTWRGVYLVTGVASLLLVLPSVRLRDPGYGHFDREFLREEIRSTVADLGEDVPAEVAKPPHAGFFEVYRSLWANRTIRLSLIGVAISGTSAPLAIAMSFYLADALDFGSSELALLNAVSSAAALVGLWTLAPFGDRLFQRSPRALYWVSSILAMVGSLSVLANVWMATTTGAFVFSILAALLGSFVGPASMVGGMTVIPPEHRHYTGAVFLLANLVGAAAGTAVFAGASQEAGLTASIVALVVVTTVGAVFSGLAGNSFLSVLDEGNDRFVEDELVRLRTAAGNKPPLLECRMIDFSYGQVQVLREANLSVQDGELVALLGLNGSGKSTLLRAVAGIGSPDAGSIRYEGYDITHASAEHRVRSGIVLMHGGRATFPSLTVGENLRSAALGEKGAARRRAVASALERFPDLRPLLNRQAGLLSGGEAQMLGLARAFLLKPRLLMIDELSLGLAPRVVADLMAQVREIHAQGTTVVVVEQSVNVAARLADRAVFLERGSVHFDGPIEVLRERHDLLRAVFVRESLT